MKKLLLCAIGSILLVGFIAVLRSPIPESRLQTSKAIKPTETTTTITKTDSEELEELHKWVQDGLASGAIHSINVEYNEVRMDPIPWSSLPVEYKRSTVTYFSRYFDLKGSTGRVIIRSKYSDEKLASYSVWTGIKIYK